MAVGDRKLTQGTALTSLAAADKVYVVPNAGTVSWGYMAGSVLAGYSAFGGTIFPHASVTDGQFLKVSGGTVISATPTVSSVTDTQVTFTDNTTGNAGTASHGFMPKAPNSTLYEVSPKDGTWVQRIIYKSANETINTNAVLQNDDELLFAVAANEIYQLDLTVYITAANTTMDFKCGWTVPAGTTMLWAPLSTSTTADPAFWSVPVASTPVGLLTESSSYSLGTLAGTNGVVFRALVTVSSTAGNVQFQWAQNTSNASNLSVLKGSNIQLKRLA